MLFGIGMFPTDYAIRPDDLARETEARGFESLWFPEHTHIPVSRKTPYPAGGDLPQEYWHTHDPFVALGAASAVTKTLKIATGICLIIQRDPITTAKEVASLDFLSNGRFIFGIGGGWNQDEIENHGADYSRRFGLLRERILAMKKIWAEDEAEYHGKYVNFDKIWSYPKPVQKPHPPILMGGDSPKTFDRIVEFCDGWMPVGLRLSELEGKAQALRQRAQAAGRDPKSISITVFNAKAEKSAIEEMERCGAERAVFMLPAAPRETVLPILDSYASVIK